MKMRWKCPDCGIEFCAEKFQCPNCLINGVKK